jgi:hypothetical protein
MKAQFWGKVRTGTPNECWPWLGYTKPSGHGLTSHQSFVIHAHRKAWILINGPIRDGLCVNHKCDNPVCCNTAHMYLGTRAENAVDRWTRPKPWYRPLGGGRPRVLTDEQLEELWEMRRAGATAQACAEKFDVHPSTIRRYITELRRKAVERFHAARLANVAK